MENIIKKILNTNNNYLDNLNTSYITVYNMYHDTSYYHGYSSKEHYRLLMYVSTMVSNEIIFDIGTNKCMSALALSFNKLNKIKTYDIVKLIPINPIINNIEYIIGDSTKDEDLKKCHIIFMDVDHDGLYENIFYNHLHSINWKGILLLDDIHLNEPMKEFWNNIIEEKYDITNIGHWSGTGLVYFK